MIKVSSFLWVERGVIAGLISVTKPACRFFWELNPVKIIKWRKAPD
jgi:hypothetical protein